MLLRILATGGPIFRRWRRRLATLLAPGTYLIEGATTPNRQPDGNSINVIMAPAGLIVFDSGRHPEHAQAILDFARSQHRPIAAIVNSHWHLDHVGGNPRLRAAYPGIPGVCQFRHRRRAHRDFSPIIARSWRRKWPARRKVPRPKNPCARKSR